MKKNTLKRALGKLQLREFEGIENPEVTDFLEKKNQGRDCGPQNLWGEQV